MAVNVLRYLKNLISRWIQVTGNKRQQTLGVPCIHTKLRIRQTGQNLKLHNPDIKIKEILEMFIEVIYLIGSIQLCCINITL